MNSSIIAKKIKKRIDENHDIISFRRRLLSYHPYDLSKAFLVLDKEYQIRLYEILSPKDMANIISYINEDDFKEIIIDMDIRYASLVISNMPKDEAADILKNLDNPDDYLKLMNKEISIELKLLSKYDNELAGSMMNTDYITIESHLDIKIAMKTMLDKANRVENIDILFVVENEKLIGTVKIKDLIISRAPMEINQIMSDKFISVSSNDDVSKVLDLIEEHNIKILPVVDDGKMVGIITIDDWFDFAYDEDTEDYNMLAGIVSNDLDDSVFSSIKKRLPWLSVLLVLSLIVSSIISIFDKVISEVTILVLFQTLILDMAGNAGTQGLAVSVRSISKGDLDDKKNAKRHMLKECRIGFFDGILLGVISFVVTLLYLLIRGYDNYLIVGIVVGLSMFFAILVAAIIGALTPIIFRKIHIDPAVASGPFITTINDCLSVLIYYALAFMLLLAI